ncbi:alpha/beta hydrolase fold domain-containing protein [Aquimarina sediminis]|uniref:alpha/beta hydrolase fold domain-containing protein n=1 Tax=Aquimarina sediminis TaxID=2070536 RepID=UPI000CA04260|nr:alpha/beta hydrolase [Aquimarina sediminis]
MNTKIYTLLVLSIILTTYRGKAQIQRTDDGTIHVPSFTLPESQFLSDKTKRILKEHRAYKVKASNEMQRACPPPKKGVSFEERKQYRECLASHFYTTPLYKKTIEKYPVDIKIDTINGVYTEVFTSKEGITKENQDKVLINLHAGAFQFDSRTASRIESIPIAALSGIKVISIDYRMGPEYQFPAASEDVASVYKSLLEEYKPQNIGIFGTAGGAQLVSQALAWFQKKNLPNPGAIGMIGMAAAEPRPKSDAMHIISAIEGYEGIAPLTVFEPYYGSDPDFDDALLVPLSSKEILSKFPPSLLIVSTRDFHMSSVVYTHTQLVKLGVEADLHVWEGLAHVFTENVELPESKEAFDVIVNFFKKHLL